MKKFVLLAVTALVGLAVFSCKEKEIEPEDALSIAGTTITVGKEAASPAVTFTANKAWTAESDSQWITPDKTSGEAGTVTLKISVAENDTWAERSGKVTVAVGALKTVFTIAQGTESVFASGFAFTISPEAQEIKIPVKTNLEYTVVPAEDTPWITVVSTKAAPQEGTITLRAAANTELAPRVGSFAVSAPGYSQIYAVRQAANWTPTASAEAIYIGNSQFIYDSETYAVNLHQQYVVKLATEGGDAVTLVLNKKGELKDDVFGFFPVDKVPAGTFEIDAAGVRADNTFSIMSSTKEEKYYTTLFQNGREVIIFDGEIVVEEAEGNYTVTAILVDATGAQHSYSYVGAIPVSSDFRAGQSTVNWKNTYFTHYTTKANSWYVEFYMPRKNPADVAEPAFASFAFYSAAGEVNLEDVPDGTYTFGTEAVDPELKYSKGITKADPGLLSNVSVALYNAAGGLQYTEVQTESTVLTIAKNEDGTKNFKYAATVKPYSYDANYQKVYGDPVPVTIDIDVPLTKATDNQDHPCDDKDDQFTKLSGPAGTVYVGFWWGGNIGSYKDENDVEQPKPAIPGTDCDIFSIGSNSYFNGVWSMQISIVAKGGYVYVKDYAGRFCSTPAPDGTYTFGTEAQIGALLPLRNGTKVTGQRTYITNTYTGTTYYPVAGTVVLKGGTITVDLTCKAIETALAGKPNSPASIHVTGTTPFSCSYLQDYSALSRVKNLNIASPVPLD